LGSAAARQEPVEQPLVGVDHTAEREPGSALARPLGRSSSAALVIAPASPLGPVVSTPERPSITCSAITEWW
jgi:hypothetical protein